MQLNQGITLELEVNQPPYTQHGMYQGTEQLSETGDNYIMIVGTVGDDIGKVIYVPERNIARIILHSA